MNRCRLLKLQRQRPLTDSFYPSLAHLDNFRADDIAEETEVGRWILAFLKLDRGRLPEFLRTLLYVAAVFGQALGV